MRKSYSYASRPRIGRTTAACFAIKTQSPQGRINSRETRNGNVVNLAIDEKQSAKWTREIQRAASIKKEEMIKKTSSNRAARYDSA